MLVADTGAKIGQLMDRILKYDKEFPLKSFHTKGTSGTKRKRARTGDGGGAGVGADIKRGVTGRNRMVERGFEGILNVGRPSQSKGTKTHLEKGSGWHE